MRIVIGLVCGACIGFAVGYVGKCTTGTCPLTSNPWISMAIGMMVGILITVGK